MPGMLMLVLALPGAVHVLRRAGLPHRLRPPAGLQTAAGVCFLLRHCYQLCFVLLLSPVDSRLLNGTQLNGFRSGEVDHTGYVLCSQDPDFSVSAQSWHTPSAGRPGAAVGGAGAAGAAAAASAALLLRPMRRLVRQRRPTALVVAAQPTCTARLRSLPPRREAPSPPPGPALLAYPDFRK